MRNTVGRFGDIQLTMFDKYSKKKSDNRQGLRSDLLLPPSANLTTSGWLEPGSARALKMLRNHCYYHGYHIIIVIIKFIIINSGWLESGGARALKMLECDIVIMILQS